MSHAAGRESEPAKFKPLSCATCSEVSGLIGFTRRGGYCRLQAISMNELSIIWGYQEELSSTAAGEPY